ncbi:MAG: hypothetical protein ABI632_11935 [Pseudolysinimonas sp.]
MDDWLDTAVKIGAVAQAGFVAFAIGFGFRQLLQGSRARELQGLQWVFSSMIDPEHKKRVNRVLSLGDDPTRWKPKDLSAAEHELEVFQQLGFYVRHRFLRRRLILQMYSLLIINMWHALRPLATLERERIKAPNFAGDFEQLALRSSAYRRRHGLSAHGKLVREGVGFAATGA